MPITDHQMKLCALDLPGLIAVAAHTYGSLEVPRLRATFGVPPGPLTMAGIGQVMLELDGVVGLTAQQLGPKADTVSVPGARWPERLVLRLRRQVREELIAAFPDLLKHPLVVLQRQGLDKMYDDAAPEYDGVRYAVQFASGELS